jgi:hypothetical protein
MGNASNNAINKISLYFCLIILSPFFYRLRLQSPYEINKIIRFSIFAAFIYPLIFPIHFMQSIKGKVGYIFLVFVYLDKKVSYEHWAVQMCLLYYVTTLFPFILFASGKKFYNTKIIILINGLFSIVLLCLSFYVTIYNVNQSISFVYLFYSTAFVYVFIILFILFLIYFC